MYPSHLQVSLDPTQDSGNEISLPLSKSVNNRALIIQALQGDEIKLLNQANARDTEIMSKLLRQSDSDYDAMDAGTTMRFMTAFLAMQASESRIHGTDRMHQRPIGILVDALNEIGANISYGAKNGYPPLAIMPFEGQKTDTIKISGSVSSQYISALMMIAPMLPNGLEINITGRVGSRPYIEMTSSLMNYFGASVDFNGAKITIPSTGYQGGSLMIEPDWSAASYWYAIVALSGKSMTLSGVDSQSFQGDREIVEMMKPLGVASEFTTSGLELTPNHVESEVKFDFTDTPDLAQTIAVVCGAKGIKAQFTGLESLRIKETDRIAALQKELGKIGAQLLESDAFWTLLPSPNLPEKVTIDTYEDHRMAMAFAPLGCLFETTINDPKVVRKSYPDFWEDLRKVGFTVN